MTLTPDDEDTVREVPQTDRSPLLVRSWGARSSVGHVRKQNEDSWGESDQRVFVVADGMGGTAGGARASALAVAGMLSANPADGWVNAMIDLSHDVRQRCDAEGLPNAGSTLVALVFDERRCVTLSVGDSRIYRLRDGVLELLTADHNLRNLRAEEGLDPDGADDRGRPGALTSYLGNPDPWQRIDVGTVAGQEDDRLLLCSDGVYGQLTDEDIANLLALPECDEAAQALVTASDNAGGRDNSTALIVELGGTT